VYILIIFNLLLTSYLMTEVYRLKQVNQKHEDDKRSALENNLAEANTLLNTGKVAEATEVVGRILES